MFFRKIAKLTRVVTAGVALVTAEVIRTAKLATIEASDATKLGRVPAALFRKVSMRLVQELGLGSLVD